MLKDIFNKIGFTKGESKVILFITGAVVLGFSVRYFTDFTGTVNKESYNFSRTDERFLAKSKKLINFNLDSLYDDPDSDTYMQKMKLLQQSEDSLRQAEKDKKEKGKKEYALTGKKININKATKEELLSLPGVGDKTADRIITYRTDNNGFKKIDEIMDVNGIGPKKFEKMKEYLTVE